MTAAKKWYTYTRSGIFYVQFKDKETGKRLTARSTRTRDKEEALRIIAEQYYNPASNFNKSQWEKHKALFTPAIQEAVKDVITSLTLSGNAPAQQIAAEKAAPLSAYPAEIRPLVKELDTLAFYDYLLLFWNYKRSPFIKQRRRLGKKIPNPERFHSNTQLFMRYAAFFSKAKLTEIAADEINTILGRVKNTGLADCSVCAFGYAMTQALRFAYRNNLLPRNIADGVTKFSNKNKIKEVFTKEELKILFSSGVNHFGREDLFLINKLLFKTGCRIGELLALQVGDLIRTDSGYALNISKSYNKITKRLKETKTGREDFVNISDATAEELRAFIGRNPFKNEPHAFLFYSNRKNRPIGYHVVERNFARTLAALGIKRNGLTLHSYRHTYAVILAAAGYSEAELKYLTRHDSLAELKRYMSHITPEMQRKNREAAYIFEKLTA